VSIGVARINKFDVNGHHIINRADAAMYKAKKKRNRIIFCEQNESGELVYSLSYSSMPGTVRSRNPIRPIDRGSACIF